MVTGGRNEGQAAGEKGKIQCCSRPCSSLKAHLDTSWFLRWGFEPFSPDISKFQHTNISKFHSQESKVLGDRYLLLVQTQRLVIVPVLTSGYSFGQFLLVMQVCTSAFFLPFIALPDVFSQQAHNSASTQLKCLGNASGCLKCKGTEMISAIKLFILMEVRQAPGIFAPAIACSLHCCAP